MSGGAEPNERISRKQKCRCAFAISQIGGAVRVFVLLIPQWPLSEVAWSRADEDQAGYLPQEIFGGPPTRLRKRAPIA